MLEDVKNGVMRIELIKCFNLLLLSIAIAVTFSCTDKSKAVKSFDVIKDLTAEQISVSEILNINNIIKLEDYIVLQNTGEGGNDFYFVYSYPDIRFLYSFAHSGRGPEEYLMPSVIKNTQGNVIGFKDHATDIIAFYELSDTAAQLMFSRTFKAPDINRFFWETNVIGDSLLLVKHQGYNTGARELWNLHSGTMVDSIGNSFPKLPHKMGKNYYTIFDDYLISASGSRFVVSYNFIDRLEIGEIKDGKIHLTASVGAKQPPKFHLYGDDSRTEFSIDRNIVTYENVYAGKDYIYALYSGKRLDATEDDHSSSIEVYTWTGEPVQQLNLDIPVAYFAVDEKDRVIYAVNPEYMDKILKYVF